MKYLIHHLGYRSQHKQRESPRGVSCETETKPPVRVLHGGNIVTYDIEYQNPIRFHYCDDNGCKGVSQDKIMLFSKKKKRSGFADMLLFDKPCLCGSFLHRNTTSLQCLLNKQYLD